MTDWAHTTTERLLLDRPSLDDVGDLFAVHGDPASWTHFPQGRHLDRERTVGMVESALRQWSAGLGYWCVRTSVDGQVVGWAGCAVPEGLPWWNLAYRLDTSVHGHGYAAELARHALSAAADVDPERPVMAYLLEHNVASRRIAERSGLSLVWRGPDEGNEDPEAVRLVFLDREPDAAMRQSMAEHGMAEHGMAEDGMV